MYFGNEFTKIKPNHQIFRDIFTPRQFSASGRKWRAAS